MAWPVTDFDGVLFNDGTGYAEVVAIHLAIKERADATGHTLADGDYAEEWDEETLLWLGDPYTAAAEDGRTYLRDVLAKFYTDIALLIDGDSDVAWAKTASLESEFWDIASITADIGMGDFDDLLTKPANHEPFLWLHECLDRLRYQIKNISAFEGGASYRNFTQSSWDDNRGSIPTGYVDWYRTQWPPAIAEPQVSGSGSTSPASLFYDGLPFVGVYYHEFGFTQFVIAVKKNETLTYKMADAAFDVLAFDYDVGIRHDTYVDFGATTSYYCVDPITVQVNDTIATLPAGLQREQETKIGILDEVNASNEWEASLDMLYSPPGTPPFRFTDGVGAPISITGDGGVPVYPPGAVQVGIERVRVLSDMAPAFADQA